MIWGGGYFAQQGAIDYSGGYVIHLAAGVAGFVAAAVIGPRLARDREIDAPNNLLMVATGAGLLWLGWNGFNGGDPYYAGADASAAILNTNLCTAVAFLVWVIWDYMTGRKPSLIGSVNGMIVGLVAITPAAGFVNGYGAMLIGVIASSIVYLAYNYLSRCRPFRNVDDTLGVIYTHGFAGVVGGLLVGVLADSNMAVYINPDGSPWFSGTGSLHLLRVQATAALWVICFTAIATFIILKFVGLFIPLRMSDKELEEGDIAIHGHEVYPSDIPSLGYTGGGIVPSPAPCTTRADRRLTVVGARASRTARARASPTCDSERTKWPRRSSFPTTEPTTTATRSRSGASSPKPARRSRSRTSGTCTRPAGASSSPSTRRTRCSKAAQPGSGTRTSLASSC